MNKITQMKRLFTIILILAVFFLLLIPDARAWAGPAELAAAPPDSLVIGIRDEPSGLDPALNTEHWSLYVSYQVYETLVSYSPGGSIPVPGLAQSWSVSPDGLTWTFTIRPGIQFHDGAVLDAAAVFYNFNRWWDPAHPYHTGSFDYFASLFRGLKGDPTSLISSLGTSGSQQFIIRLTEPYSLLPSVLTSPVLAIASPAAIQGGLLSTAPVGSGPFRFGEWAPGSHIRLDANPAYWAGKPLLDHLTFEVITSDSNRLTALQNNVIQAARDLPDSHLTTALLDENLRLFNHPLAGIGYLGINRSKTPLDNILVRQAIAHAINKPKLIEDHFRRNHHLASQFLPPTIWGYNPAAPVYDYNPTLALSLLAQAGYSGGFTTTLAFRNAFRSYLPDPATTAQAIHDDLLAVGINAVVTEYPPSEFITKYQNGELDLFLLGWFPDYLHPDNYFWPHFCNPDNLGFGPQDAPLCSLIDSAQNEPDFSDQLGLYRSASARVMEILPAVPLAHQSSPPLVVRREIAGITSSALGFDGYLRVFYATSWSYLPFTTR